MRLLHVSAGRLVPKIEFDTKKLSKVVSLKFYISYRNIRLLGPFPTLDEAAVELFSLRGTFRGLYIEIVDPETGKRMGTIGLKKNRKKK